ncbi:hypothetical protein D3C78_916490 [compost metagenome]
MDLERLQIRLVAREHGDAHLHVALATVLVEVGHESRRHRLENRWLLADRSGLLHCGGRLALSAVHEVPGRPHGHTDRQQQGHHDHDNQLEFAFGCGVFYCCVALRHANNPSLIGFSQSHGKARASVMPCRSEPAREEFKNGAFSQQARVIVNDHREQARSYRGGRLIRRSNRPRWSRSRGWYWPPLQRCPGSCRHPLNQGDRRWYWPDRCGFARLVPALAANHGTGPKH